MRSLAVLRVSFDGALLEHRGRAQRCAPRLWKGGGRHLCSLLLQRYRQDYEAAIKRGAGVTPAVSA